MASSDMTRIWFSVEELEAIMRALPEDIDIRNHALSRAVAKIDIGIKRQKAQTKLLEDANAEGSG